MNYQVLQLQFALYLVLSFYENIFFALLILPTVILSSKPAYCASKQSTSDTAYIYVFRVGKLAGSAGNWPILLDGKEECRLSNKKYMRLAVSPGKHKIFTRIPSKSLFKKGPEMGIQVDATAGENYYVACNFSFTITKGKYEMTQVSNETAAKQMKGLRLDNCQKNID
ncbi:DUF2846 domain-containing protein [Terrimonas alba]|uniref:DUF2846 domain-containing protein n=1 Tax=Terrimonas alba TaxID=3349636 RepID=UPI0035F466FA